jgi:hypothetical protein
MRGGAVCILVGLALALSGCSAAQQTPTLVPPTAALIPSTETPTPTPIPPTNTPQALTAPEQFGVSPTPLTPQETLVDSLIAVDPIAAELVGVAQRALAEQLNLATRRIRLVEVQPVVWDDASLGCPSPNVAYTQVEINGYRIVLRAADQDYFYHTDFDRVFLCAAENEQLPDDFTPLAEETSEATPES